MWWLAMIWPKRDHQSRGCRFRVRGGDRGSGRSRDQGHGGGGGRKDRGEGMSHPLDSTPG